MVIVAGAAWLRTRHFTESFWLDELHTAWAAGGALPQVAPRAMTGNQPPLAYWLLWCWAQVAGLSEFSLRLPSLAASLAAVALAFYVVMRWTRSPLAGLVAALAVALEPASTFYGGEARVYAWLECLGLAHVALLAKVFRTGSAQIRAAWVALGLVLFHTHYTAMLLLAAEAVVMAGYVAVRRSSYSWRAALLDLSLLAAGTVPLWPHLLEVAARRDNWKFVVAAPSATSLWQTVPAIWPLATVGGCAALAAMIPQRRAGNTEGVFNSVATGAAVVAAVLTVVIAAAWTLSASDTARLFWERYLMVVFALPAVLLATLLGALRHTAWRWLAAGLALAVLLSTNNTVSRLANNEPLPARHENWRGAVAWLNQQQLGNDAMLLLASGLIEADRRAIMEDPRLREFCAYPLHSAYRLSADAQIVPLPFVRPGRLAPEVAAEVRARRATYIIYRGGADRGRQQFQADLRASAPGHRLRRLQSFGHVHVYVLRR